MRRTHTARRLLSAAALVLASVVGAANASADDLADEADLQFSLGNDSYQAGDFQKALEHFLASNRLVPNKNVLFNIARSYEQLKRAPDAYRYYVQARDRAVNVEQDADLRRRIEEAIARITPLVAVLKIETSPPGATVYLDRKDLGSRGQTPRTLGLAPGRHKVIVELPGHEPVETPEPVEVVIGKEVTIKLPLTQILGTVRVEGEPGASVRLDAEDAKVACVTPCSTSASPGRHVLHVSKPGFVSSEYVAEIPARQVAVVRPKLAPQTGAVVVNADVRDALVSVDGQPMGFTPSVLSMPVGRHVVRVSQSGYRTVERVVDVAPKSQQKLELQLGTLEEVTAASRVTESAEDAPASVSIVSAQEIRAMGYPTVAEAVRGVRGLYLSDDRSYVTVGFRGFSRPGDYGNRVLVLLDGQPMNDNYIWSSYVGYDGRVDIDDIERIEVVRGPGSVLYGTSAFFGVINLVTRARKPENRGEFAVSTAEHGVGRLRATATARLGERSGAWASVAVARGAGRDLYFPEYVANPQDPGAERGANGLPVDGHARGVDGFSAVTASGRVWHEDLTLQWLVHSRNKHIPTGEYGTLLGDHRNHFADTRGMVEARFEPQVGKTVQLLSRAHANMYDFDAASAYAPPDGVARDTFRGRWGGLEQRAVLTPTRGLRLTVGGEVIRHFQALQVGESASGPYVFDDRGNPGRNDPFTVAAGYALADAVVAPAVKLSGGARFDYYSNVARLDAGASVNPRLSAVLKPYDGGNVKIMVGKAFRTPSVYELFYTSVTQVRPLDLQPEQIYSGEVEYSHRFSPLVTGTVAVYTNYVKDLIELRDLAGGQTQYANSGAPVLVLGSEFEVRREWRGGWMLAATYSLQRVNYLDDPTLRDVPNSPWQLASLKGAAPIIGRSLVAMTRITFEGDRPDRNFRASDPPQGTTDPGVVWDLVFSGEAERQGIRYAIGAYNLADWKYDIVPSGEFRQRTIVQSGRTFLASLAVGF